MKWDKDKGIALFLLLYMRLDKLLWFSLKVLLVVLFIEIIVVLIYMSSDNEEEYNNYLPNPIEQL